MSPLIWELSIVTLLITTHEPPSRLRLLEQGSNRRVAARLRIRIELRCCGEPDLFGVQISRSPSSEEALHPKP